ncbi:hypothetical protein P4O66_006469, partial [Electrophorus voltai]
RGYANHGPIMMCGTVELTPPGCTPISWLLDERHVRLGLVHNFRKNPLEMCHTCVTPHVTPKSSPPALPGFLTHPCVGPAESPSQSHAGQSMERAVPSLTLLLHFSVDDPYITST